MHIEDTRSSWPHLSGKCHRICCISAGAAAGVVHILQPLQPHHAGVGDVCRAPRCTKQVRLMSVQPGSLLVACSLCFAGCHTAEPHQPAAKLELQPTRSPETVKYVCRAAVNSIGCSPVFTAVSSCCSAPPACRDTCSSEPVCQRAVKAQRLGLNTVCLQRLLSQPPASAVNGRSLHLRSQPARLGISHYHAPTSPAGRDAATAPRWPHSTRAPGGSWWAPPQPPARPCCVQSRAASAEGQVRQRGAVGCGARRGRERGKATSKHSRLLCNNKSNNNSSR